jgi:hypothetical protein
MPEEAALEPPKLLVPIPEVPNPPPAAPPPLNGRNVCWAWQTDMLKIRPTTPTAREIRIAVFLLQANGPVWLPNYSSTA